MKNPILNPILALILLVTSFNLISASLLAKDMTGKDFVDEAKGSIKSISVSDTKEMLNKSGVVFMDVREPEEYKAGHIPGSLNIPRGLLEFQIEQQVPDRNTTLVVYCRSGNRSALAAATLVKMGYKNVLNVDGGWKAWLDAGYPAE